MYAPMQMIFDLTAKKLISYDSTKSSENLRDNFVAFIQGLISFPLDVPGTAYHKCLQVSPYHPPKLLVGSTISHGFKIFNRFFSSTVQPLHNYLTILANF